MTKVSKRAGAAEGCECERTTDKTQLIEAGTAASRRHGILVVTYRYAIASVCFFLWHEA